MNKLRQELENVKAKLRAMENKLETFLDSQVRGLEQGQSDNFYHYIAHAMGRSLLYENNQSKIDISFVIDAWKGISWKKQDRRYMSSNRNLTAVRAELEGLTSWYSARGEVQGYWNSRR